MSFGIVAGAAATYFGATAGTAALIGAGAGALGSGLLGSSSARQASSAQSDSAAQATEAASANADKQIALQREIFNQNRTDQAPFREAGVQANNRLAEMMRGGQFEKRFTTADMNADPVYQSGLQFGLDQGTQGINRQAAAGGNMLSGATLKALTRFGSDYGSQRAGEAYSRFNNDQSAQYNRFAGLSGAGQQATNQVGQAGQNFATGATNAMANFGNAQGNNITGAGNARASGYIASNNSWQNALNQGVSAYNNRDRTPQDPFNGTGMWSSYAN